MAYHDPLSMVETRVEMIKLVHSDAYRHNGDLQRNENPINKRLGMNIYEEDAKPIKMPERPQVKKVQLLNEVEAPKVLAFGAAAKNTDENLNEHAIVIGVQPQDL